MTVLTKHRRRLFDRDDAAVLCRQQLVRAAGVGHFAIRAGSVMPDHIHLLVEGLRGDSNFKRFIKLAKQLTGFHVKQITGYSVWVDGYFERVVRHDEDPGPYVEYILNNPIKAGLAATIGIHPHTWADPDWSTSKPDLQVGRLANQQQRANETPGHGILSLGRSSPD